MMENLEETDEDIVNRIVSGDHDAFALLIRRYETALNRYVTYLIHDRVASEDAVQETFIKAYQNLAGFKKQYRFSSWIYRIAHNEAINIVRSQKHLTDTDIDELPERSVESTIIRDIDRAILKSELGVCLSQLDTKFREVLMLQYYENLTYEEIGDILHIPVTTVGVWALRA